MNPYIAAIYQLSKGGYSVHTSVSGTKDFIIESPEGVLSKVLVRTASSTGSTPLLTLSPKYRNSEYLQAFGYCLAVEPLEPKVWLIPVDDFPIHSHSLRLGERFEQYVVRTYQEGEGFREENLRRSIQSKIGSSNSIKQEDLEGILSMTDY